jgi:hypothetical protein
MGGITVTSLSVRAAERRKSRATLSGSFVTPASAIGAARARRLPRLLRLVRGFAWLAHAWPSVMLTCSAWLYIAQHGAANGDRTAFRRALLGVVVTLTTVGYGDVAGAIRARPRAT